jgi:hypothetical protein
MRRHTRKGMSGHGWSEEDGATDAGGPDTVPPGKSPAFPKYFCLRGGCAPPGSCGEGVNAYLAILSAPLAFHLSLGMSG